MNPYSISAVLSVAALALIACSSDRGADDSPPGSPDMLRVVSTVSPITSLVENIGGPRIRLDGIVPEGVNSHTFEPPPSVARIISQADLIVLNGLFLEEPFREMAEANKKPDAVILTLGDNTITRAEWIFDASFPESGGHPNPHLWTNPILALEYADLIHRELSALDPDNAAYYDANYAKLEARIADLDKRIADVIQTIPPENRKLLTYHDSFPFFANRYGMQIIGAVQPSDFTEPSAREVANLIDQIRAANVPAVFGSEVFPSPVMQQIARESGAQFIDELRDDDLPGSHGNPRHTYFGLMVSNMEIIAPALGGSAAPLEGFDPSPVFEDDSNANYPE